MVQAYCDDGSSKSLVAASDCSVFWLRQQLVGKCRAAPSLAWTLVEQLPSLHLERELEEDEKISDILEAWERPNDNRLLFSSRPGRLDLFRRPEKYLAPMDGGTINTRRSLLLQEFFIDSNDSALSIEGPLWLKLDGKKAWRRHIFILRSTGIYFSPKEWKPFRKAQSSTACLVSFAANCPTDYYLSVGWGKKYKAPTEYGFAISREKPIRKDSLTHLCAETEQSRREWQTGLRVAQRKERLWANFQHLLIDLKERSRSPPVCSPSAVEWRQGPTTLKRSPPSLETDAEEKVGDSAIYSPSSESKSCDSGVCSLSEVRGWLM